MKQKFLYKHFMSELKDYELAIKRGVKLFFLSAPRVTKSSLSKVQAMTDWASNKSASVVFAKKALL